MNLLDVAFVVLLVVGVVAGIRSGALPQLGGLLGAVGGGTAVLRLAPLAREPLDTLEPPLRALAVLSALLFGVGTGEMVGSTMGRYLSYRLGRGFLGSIDRAAGGLLGIAQAVLVVWLAGGLLAVGPFPTLAAQAQRSTTVRAMSEVLPPAPEVAADIVHLLDVSGLPDVFVGLEPFPAPPVDLPGSERAEAMAGDAVDSTFEVLSTACGYQLVGTGFVVAPGYVVTNAHVVAGARRVSLRGEDVRQSAAVVLFDSALDVAVLHAPGIRAAALHFATSDPERGSEAATIGYPGGGPQVVLPAAVTDTYRAEGRDLYGEKRVRRDVIELRAAVDRGASGGPLVLADGTVGGVVFAEARSDPSVGYALSPVDVAVTVQGALGRTAEVPTGRCIR